MAVRKRNWTSGGKEKSAWVVDYRAHDPRKGKDVRCLKTFPTKRAAESWATDTLFNVKQGIHTPDSASTTVAEAGDSWLAQARADGLERSTTANYEGHLKHHIKPVLGAVKLSRLTGPTVRDFERKLLEGGRSSVLAHRIVISLGAILAHAQEEGRVARNVVREASRNGRRRKRGQAKRQRNRAEIPSKDEIRALLEKADGRWRPLVVTAIFTGLRSSELRGVTWADVDVDQELLTVSQRADAWNAIGPPKSDAGWREIPLAPMVVNTLKAWRLQCPRQNRTKDDSGELEYVFPNGAGNIEARANIITRGFHPLQIECAIVDENGKPKYGLHALRHVAASLFIEQGFMPKRVQALMGHSTIQMTFDTYGHLFPTPEDDQAAMRQLQARLVG